MKKLVAIGGGGNGTITRSGIKKPYELREIDREIVRLTGKKHPNFLFLGHAQIESDLERGYFEAMQKTYHGVFGCACKTIERDALADMSEESIDNLIGWADIIYESGGDTKELIELWRATHFDDTLRKAWEEGKVLAGISAGACCWFDSCCSDSLKKQRNDPTASTIDVECLGFFDAYFSPHYNVVTKHTNRAQHMKNSLKTRNIIGIGLSNCAALEIVDNTYRLLTTDASAYNIQAYGARAYYRDGVYVEERLAQTTDFASVQELL